MKAREAEIFIIIRKGLDSSFTSYLHLREKCNNTGGEGRIEKAFSMKLQKSFPSAKPNSYVRMGGTELCVPIPFFSSERGQEKKVNK